MLKILQARLQQYMNHELPDVQAGFSFIDNAKAFACVDHNNLWKILKEMQILDHLTCHLTMQVKKQQLELDLEQQTGSKLEKESVKSVYCHPAY